MIQTRRKNRLPALLMSLGILALAFGCTVADKKTGKPLLVAPSESILRVGVSTNAPPLIFKQDQRIVGLEADLAKRFAKYLGKSVYFIELEWKDQIPALLENRIDIIMSGMTVTALREVRIAFSNSYFKSGQMALIRSEEAGRFLTGFYSVTKSSAIGVIENTTGAFFVREHFGYAKQMEFKTSTEAIEDLIDGKIDMFIHDAPIILYLASENETRGVTPLLTLLTEEYLAWGIRKTDPALLASANGFLQKLETDGELKPMLKRWIPFIH